MASTPLAPADARRELLVARAEALEAGSAEAVVKDPPTRAESSAPVTQLPDELTAARAVLGMMREQYGAATKELQTVNNELKLKFDMVSRAHRDLQNLIRATAVGTMFLDTSL